ncbi:MAG: hypothetical protein K2M98_06220, partial [Muribaculum sp.]|nr:hypothetical protein [Muribaculum sp.]
MLELESMTLNQLQEIASNMGLKKAANSDNPEEIAYAILDEQAVIKSQTVTAEKSPRDKKKRDTAQKTAKNKQQKKDSAKPENDITEKNSEENKSEDTIAVSADNTPAQNITEETVAPPKRKRGRPAKIRPTEATSIVESSDTKNLPPVSDNISTETNTTNTENTISDTTQSETIIAEQSNTGDNATSQEISKADSTTVPETTVQQEKRDRDFGSFFHSERKFVPRSQREKDAAAAMAANA